MIINLLQMNSHFKNKIKKEYIIEYFLISNKKDIIKKIDSKSKGAW